jgi:recombination protein RecT
MFEFYEDDDIRESKPIVGYLAYFELLNGFKKQLFWTISKMEIHADTYSQAFNLEDYHRLQRNEVPQKDMWKYSSFWYKNFDEMAEKTMLRQLISKWGIMSIEMQSAVEKDMAEIKTDGQAEYVDNQPIELNVEPQAEPVQEQPPMPQEYDPLA